MARAMVVFKQMSREVVVFQQTSRLAIVFEQMSRAVVVFSERHVLLLFLFFFQTEEKGTLCVWHSLH